MANMSSGLYVLPWRDTVNDASPTTMNLTSAATVVCLMLDTFATNEAFDTINSYTTTITDYEVSDSAPGYDRGVKQVGGTPTCGLGNAGQLKYTWSAAVEWTSATLTANGMVLLAVTSSIPICAVGYGANYTATNGTFSVTAHANGIFYIDLVP